MVVTVGFVKCGMMVNGLGSSPIYCDTDTGDMILADDLNGNCILSNLGSPDPQPAKDVALYNLIKYYGAEGVIITGKYLIVLKDFKASYRDYSNLDVIVKEVDYDTDIEYTGDCNFEAEV